MTEDGETGDLRNVQNLTLSHLVEKCPVLTRL